MGSMSPNTAAFFAGSFLVLVVGVSLYVRSLDLRVPERWDRPLLYLSAVRSVAMGALVVMFVSAAFAR
jgi:hypothetical protein